MKRKIKIKPPKKLSELDKLYRDSREKLETALLKSVKPQRILSIYPFEYEQWTNIRVDRIESTWIVTLNRILTGEDEIYYFGNAEDVFSVLNVLLDYLDKMYMEISLPLYLRNVTVEDIPKLMGQSFYLDKGYPD